MTKDTSDGDLAKLAAAAYVVGFPLVFDLEQVKRYVTTGIGANPAAPFNSFSHTRTLSGPDDQFVSLNNDTLYSMGSLDMSGGPLLFHVPDTGSRYTVFQFVDAWTNNFAYVGMRATGTGEGTYLLAPPGWSGSTLDGVERITVPTPIASIVGRWGCAGIGDLAAIAALQDQLRLEPLEPDQGTGAGLPEPEEGVDNELLFFEKLRLWTKVCPPSPGIQAQLESFRSLGILDDTSPYVDPSSELREALVAGAAAGHQQLVEILRAGTGTRHNGWSTALHTFDYNTEFFELGTIDTPDWKIDDPRRRHHHPRDRRPWRAVGQPRLRSRLLPHLRRRRRQPTRRSPPLHPHLPHAPTMRGVLVRHHVRPARLLHGRQPHRPILHRRPHQRTPLRTRRLVDPDHPARPTLRGDRARQLAPRSSQSIPTDPARLRPLAPRSSTAPTKYPASPEPTEPFSQRAQRGPEVSPIAGLRTGAWHERRSTACDRERARFGVPRCIGCARTAVSPVRSAWSRCRLVRTERCAATFSVASSRSRRTDTVCTAPESRAAPHHRSGRGCFGGGTTAVPSGAGGVGAGLVWVVSRENRGRRGGPLRRPIGACGSRCPRGPTGR